jgi:hypothetical protein
MTETPIGFASGFPCGADLETLRDFTRVSSDFYPDLGFHYSRVIDEWYSAREELQSEGQQ